MIIKIGNDTLCDGADRGVDKSCGPAPGGIIAGNPIEQGIRPLRARWAQMLNREGETTTLQFSVTRLCSTPAAAWQWAVLHHATVTRSGTVILTDTGLGVRILNCVLVPKCVPDGASVHVSYAITGGKAEVIP